MKTNKMEADVTLARNFRDSFKYYKQKTVYKDAQLLSSINESHKFIEVAPDATYVGAVRQSRLSVFKPENCPGLTVIRNPLTPIEQRYWIRRCLQDYQWKPNLRYTDIDRELSQVDDLWNYSLGREKSIIDNLRWITLGYHHDWNTKVYSEARRSPFPEDLGALSRHFAKAAGFPEFSAEAAIVNFYHMNSTLAGHVDSSEEYLDAPIISFSFGQSAVFLIGGPSLDTPVILHSGDVVIMSGQARLCYHAIPRILAAPTSPWKETSVALQPLLAAPTSPWNQTSDAKLAAPTSPWNEKTDAQSGEPFYFDSDIRVVPFLADDACWQPFEEYISRVRINVNVRQVLEPGKLSLNS